VRGNDREIKEIILSYDEKEVRSSSTRFDLLEALAGYLRSIPIAFGELFWLNKVHTENI
jgi:hypothetical protein